MKLQLEPVAFVNAVATVLEAGIALAVGFGLNWSAAQVGLVMALVVAVGNVVTTILVRSRVTPVAAPHNNQGQRLVPEST